ncbi:MAG: FkbM family methyltransferase [Pseudomonadota bacterium]
MNLSEKIIYDVGANNGDDTDFYLRKGFRVVAVEADPELASALTKRFADQIAEGRLTVLAEGAGEAHETLAFYRRKDKRDWSSFYKGKAAAAAHDVLEIPVRPLSEMIAQHGAPYYLKIDVEGYELPALRSLRQDTALPEYLSFEINLDWSDILDVLASLGYGRFQLIRQGKQFLLPQPDPVREGVWAEVEFKGSMSGIFGRDLPDAWVGRDRIEGVVAAAKSDPVPGAGWCDIHCHRR